MKEMEEQDWRRCAVHLEAQERGICAERSGAVAYCERCGHAMCPTCGNHNVLQISRITGYMSDVSGWNAAKRQELKDRKRYTLEG